MSLTIKTDHKWKNFRYYYEVPETIKAGQFEHLREDVDNVVTDGFILYRHRWYHMSDFMVPSPGNPLVTLGYDGYLSDTYFSGVAIQVSKDGEQYRIATFYS